MQDLSLHILDIVENSIEAGATKIEIVIHENTKRNRLTLKIRDNGKGMSKKTLTKVIDPFYTTKKTRRVGLGLSMLSQASKEAEGNFNIKSKIGKGTTIAATFVYDHIDRKPLGDLADTIVTLIATNGLENDFIYKHNKNGIGFVLDTRSLKKELKDVQINDPGILNFLRNEIRNGLKTIEKRRRKK